MSISSQPAPAGEVKLFLRLATEINEGLRSLLRYRDDLSRLVEQALVNTDLARVILLPTTGNRQTQRNNRKCQRADGTTSQSRCGCSPIFSERAGKQRDLSLAPCGPYQSWVLAGLCSTGLSFAWAIEKKERRSRFAPILGFHSSEVVPDTYRASVDG